LSQGGPHGGGVFRAGEIGKGLIGERAYGCHASQSTIDQCRNLHTLGLFEA
jgi:hypothetical protein